MTRLITNMPTQMYAQQAPAFAMRQEFTPRKTDSTPTTPPSHAALDLSALADKKRTAIKAAPTTCVHCKSAPCPLSEIRDGSVMAYCSSKTCGRSLVVFTPPELSIPVYEKVCIYRSAEAAPTRETFSAPAAGPNHYVGPTSGAVQQQSVVPVEQQQPRPQQQQQQQLDEAELAQLVAEFGNRPVMCPEATMPNCVTCGKTFMSHRMHEVDTNGWVEKGRRPVQLPTDWPTFNASTKTFSNLN